MFTHDGKRNITCAECGELCLSGQLLSFAYNVYRHVICPTED